MYAFVDVQQYQIVGTGGSVKEARENYISKLSAGDVTPAPEKETAEVIGTVIDIKSAVVGGNTTYYIYLDDNNFYTASITVSDGLPFIDKGAKLKLTVTDKTVTSLTVMPNDEMADDTVNEEETTLDGSESTISNETE